MTETTYLNSVQVAAMLGVSKPTIESWRYKGVGPQYVKLGVGPRPAIRYRLADVEAWLTAQTVGGAVC